MNNYSMFATRSDKIVNIIFCDKSEILFVAFKYFKDAFMFTTEKQSNIQENTIQLQIYATQRIEISKKWNFHRKNIPLKKWLDTVPKTFTILAAK